MSRWINDGLRILTDYFGAEDEKDAVVAATGVEDKAAVTDEISHSTEQQESCHEGTTNKAAKSVDPVPSNINAYENGLASPKRSNEGAKKRFRQSESKSQEKDDNDDTDDEGKGEGVELHPLFAMHLKELKKFTVAHGHMNVPAKDKSGKRNKLRNWMIRQRLRYLALPDSYCNNRVMTQAEIDSLNAIGFQWEGLEDRELPRSFAVFLEELKEFVAEHGHLDVPVTDHSGRRSSLRNWMICQRLRYRALPGAYYNNRVMTQAEINALNEIGFQWELPEVKVKSPLSPARQTPINMGSKVVARISSVERTKEVARQTRKAWPKKSPIQWTSGKDNGIDAPFRKRVEELKAFVAEHGHMKPPSFENGNRCRLYSWMNHQRLRRRALPNRYHNSLHIRQAEIDALDAIGFDWELSRTSPEPAVNKRNSRSAPSSTANSSVPLPSPRKRPRHSRSRAAETKPVAESTSPEDQLDPTFRARFQELLDFKSKNGHMDAKTGTVYSWSKYQRLRRRAFPLQYGKRGRPMTQAEVDALDAVGFDWRGANDDEYE